MGSLCLTVSISLNDMTHYKDHRKLWVRDYFEVTKSKWIPNGVNRLNLTYPCTISVRKSHFEKGTIDKCHVIVLSLGCSRSTDSLPRSGMGKRISKGFTLIVHRSIKIWNENMMFMRRGRRHCL